MAATVPNSDRLRRVTVHSPRMSNNGYLLDLLNGGIWFSEQVHAEERRRTVVDVRLHPIGSPWVRWVRTFTDLSTVPVKVRRRLVKWYRAVTGAGSSDAGHQEPSIIDRIRVRASSVYLRVDDHLNVEMHRMEVGYGAAAVPTLRACLQALQCWRNCRRDGRMDVQALLQLRYRGVHIGDLVASETIGLHQTAGGSLRQCGALALVGCLADAVYTVDYILGQSWTSGVDECVTTSETTYLEELYRRTLQLQGFYLLELYDYSGRLRLIPPGEGLPNPFVARADAHMPLSAQQKERTWKYLAERTRDAGQHLWYMNVGQNRHGQEGVTTVHGHVLERDDRALTAVIFLHSFDDAQYMFGLDGFDDLYEWTVASIEGCLANRQIGRVLIKEHPNIDLETFPSDKYAVRRLKRRFQHESRVQYIDRCTDVKALLSLGRVYGITNHGSVAEELVAVGIPVIATSKAPWGGHYPFVHFWDSPADYAALLRGLTVDGWQAPGHKEMEALIRFVNEYRLNNLPGQDLPVSVQWMMWKDPAVNILTPDISVAIEQQVSTLGANDPQMIQWLRDRANGYRDHRGPVRANAGVHRNAQGVR